MELCQTVQDDEGLGNRPWYQATSKYGQSSNFQEEEKFDATTKDLKA